MLHATAAGSAVPNVDYLDVNGTLNFGNGQALATFDVPIFDDADPESSETVNLTLFGVTGSAVLGQSSASLTIVDNDFSPGLIGFESQSYAVSEQGTVGGFSLVLYGRTVRDV